MTFFFIKIRFYLFYNTFLCNMGQYTKINTILYKKFLKLVEKYNIK